MNLFSEAGDILDQLLKFPFSDVQLEKRPRHSAEKSASCCADGRNMGQRGKIKHTKVPFVGLNHDTKATHFNSSVYNLTDDFTFFF